MSTSISQGSRGVCPEADALLRLAHGYSSTQEREQLQQHLAECDSCRTDRESLEFAGCELLVAEADRRALRDFTPGAAVALCKSLDDEQLRRIAAGQPPAPVVQAHIEDCAYCRQRFFSHVRSKGRLPLMGQLMEALVQPELESAALRVAAADGRAAMAVPLWTGGEAVERLVEQLKAWYSEAGQMIAEGLETCLRPPTMAHGKALDSHTVEGGDSSLAERAWQIPVEQPKFTLSLRIRPTARHWEMHCEVFDAPGVDRQLWLALEDLNFPGGSPLVSGPLATVTAVPWTVSPGSWQLKLWVGERTWLIPVELGPLSANP